MVVACLQLNLRVSPPDIYLLQDMLTRLLSALVGVIIVATPVIAQNANVRRRTAIGGVVRDSALGRAARKYSVCTWIPTRASMFSMRCAQVDSVGAYRLDGLPLLGLRISVSCETLRGMGKLVASDSIVFTDTSFVRRDWIVSTTGCDPRRLRQAKGVFRGYYTLGFESSAFVPCAADAWFIPGDSLGAYPFDARNAWVTWDAGAARGQRWPEVARDRHGYSKYYVRWRGTVVGPGRYGHMGVFPFELSVDTVFELRAARKKDCR
jgi:hypothetical protein